MTKDLQMPQRVKESMFSQSSLMWLRAKQSKMGLMSVGSEIGSGLGVTSCSTSSALSHMTF